MSLVDLLVVSHAWTGGIALCSGLLSIIAKKGGKLHRNSGLVFYFTMLTAGVTAMVVTCMPGHESPFMFAIGIFSLYFVISGKRALRFKSEVPDLTLDKLISWWMLITGVLMIIYPIFMYGSFNIVLLVFGVAGIIFSIGDLKLFHKIPEKLKTKWLKIHLGKMLGAYISATTAFIVVNQFIPGVIGWLAPGIVGGFLIFYWSRKVSNS